MEWEYLTDALSDFRFAVELPRRAELVRSLAFSMESKGVLSMANSALSLTMNARNGHILRCKFAESMFGETGA